VVFMMPPFTSSRTIVANATILAAVVLLVLFARRDRAASIRPETTRKVADTGADQAAAEAEQALTDVEAKLVAARKELKATEEKLEDKKRALDRAAVAPAPPPVPNQPAAAAIDRPVAVPAAVDEERRQLAREVEDLRKQVADNKAKADAQKQDVEKRRAEQAGGKRPGAVAVKPADPDTLGRGRIVDQQTRFHPRRFRDPALGKFEPDAAAVAAAGSGGAARGGGVVFPGSTVGGDIARGQAEFIRAAGEFNLNNSKSAINLQTAKSKEMDNRLRWTETFFEMRRVNRTNRAIEAGPRPTMDQVVHYARMQAPRRLASTQLDTVTGEIVWPPLLTDKAFADNREFLQGKFKQRAQQGGSIDIAQIEEVETAVDDFKDELKEVGLRRSPKRYGAARTFLDSLKLEYELPVQ
jgi:Skp family chaperone for outer membrane proteins